MVFHTFALPLFFCSLLEQIDWVIYLVASVLVAGIPSFIFYKKDKAFK